MAATQRWGRCGRNPVEVRVLSPAPFKYRYRIKSPRFLDKGKSNPTEKSWLLSTNEAGVHLNYTIKSRELAGFKALDMRV